MHVRSDFADRVGLGHLAALRHGDLVGKGGPDGIVHATDAEEALFVPLGAGAGFPGRGTEIAELAAAATTTYLLNSFIL